VRPPIGNLLAYNPLDIIDIDFTLLEPASDGLGLGSIENCEF